MVRSKKDLAETRERNDEPGQNKEQDDVLLYVELVDRIKRSRNKDKTEAAFNTIVKMLDSKMQQISHKFKIPGHGFQDIYQEALYALRFKAIKDYDPDRSDLKTISPFDKFAALCIRRHLSTKLKASYQNKSRVLNSAISLDQNKNTSDNGGDNLFLSDIIPTNNKDIASDYGDRERRKLLLLSLFQRLSVFEKEVFVLYCKKYSYDEIAYFINRNKSKKGEKITVKGVDNALSRLKQKAKIVFKKYGK